MPAPWKHPKTGSYYLNRRVPADVSVDAIQASTDTLSFFKLVTDPENRYEIIQRIEKGLAEMKTYEHQVPEF